MKFKNPFKLLQKKDEYREKDQRIVSRWLSECEDEKFTADELLNLAIKFLVMILVTIYQPTSWSRKAVLNMIDQRLKEAFKVKATLDKQGKNVL
jgi:hypothetical protein